MQRFRKEELLKKLDWYINTYKKIPKIKDINQHVDMPNHGMYYQFFDNLNDAIKKLGYKTINKSSKSYSDDELILQLQNLYKELGKTPTSRDIANCNYCCVPSVFERKFGSLYTAFKIAKIPYNKRFKFYSDEEIINKWYEIKEQLNKIPNTTELIINEHKILSSIIWRWNTYYNFLNIIGELENYKKQGNKVYITTNGTFCLSYYELIITQFFEDNNVDFVKEVPYRHVILDDKSKRRFDWIVYNGENVFYIEMFGIVNNESYDIKRRKKIKLCDSYNINLIKLYPENVLKKPLDEVFYFLSGQRRKEEYDRYSM